MKESIHIVYRDERVDYHEHTDNWYWGKAEKQNASLKWICDRIDASLKSKLKKPVKAYYRKYYNNCELVEVSVTSVTEDGDYWIVEKTSNGTSDRRKARKEELFAFSPENIQANNKAKVLLKQAEQTERAARALMAMPEPFSLDAAISEMEEQ